MGGEQSGTRNYSGEELTYLQQLSDNDYRSEDIAFMFYEKFKRLITRNSVIGLWCRGAIKRPVRMKSSPGAGVAFDFKNRVSKTRKRAPARDITKAKMIAKEIRIRTSDAWKPIEGIEPISILDIREGTCHWPLDTDNGTMFCGALTEPFVRQPYCSAHQNLNNRPRT